jgi:hypothetical protein
MEIEASKLAMVCITVIGAAAVIAGSLAGMDAALLVSMASTCISAIAALAGYNVGFRQGLRKA